MQCKHAIRSMHSQVSPTLATVSPKPQPFTRDGAPSSGADVPEWYLLSLRVSRRWALLLARVEGLAEPVKKAPASSVPQTPLHLGAETMCAQRVSQLHDYSVFLSYAQFPPSNVPRVVATLKAVLGTANTIGSKRGK